MAKQDYYSTLGVAKDADLETLKKAYRKLAMQYHPDRNHGDAAAEQKFKELSEAYDVLKDEQKRAAYDRFGHAAFENGNGRGGPAGFDFTASGFADIFDEMFGEFTGRGRPGEPASSWNTSKGGGAVTIGNTNQMFDPGEGHFFIYVDDPVAASVAGVGVREITLHVGYGTFKPVKADQVEDHSVDPESYSISNEAADRINRARADGRPKS